MDSFLKRIPLKLFNEWRAYADLEPFDEKREDIRNAQLAKWLAEIYRGMLILGGTKNVNQQALKLEDYILPFGEQEPAKPKQTWQEKKQIALLIASAYGAEIPDEVRRAS